MGKVYRIGLFNIAACSGINSHQGVFTERNPNMSQPLVVDQEYSDQAVEITLLPDWVSLDRDTAPLYKRGWVLQERILSPRIMHFSKFPFWECGEGLTTEIYPSHFDTQSLRFPCFPESQRKWLSPTRGADESTSRWWELVKLYTKCDLTYGSDKLIALSGMASILLESIKEPYLAGIWGGKYLILGLAWRVSGGSRRHILGSKEYRGLSEAI